MERFVRSIKEECLDRLIPIGEQHPKHAIDEYIAHYHQERNHQGMDNQLIEPCAQDTLVSAGTIRCRERVGGMLRSIMQAEGQNENGCAEPMALIVRPKHPYTDWADSFDDGGPNLQPANHRPRAVRTTPGWRTPHRPGTTR